MSKRSPSVFTLSEKDLERIQQETGVKVISDLGEHRINQTLVDQAIKPKAKRSDLMTDHRLYSLIGKQVKIAPSAPIWKNRNVTLIELTHNMGATWATVENAKGEQKLVEDVFISEKPAHKHGAKPGWYDGFYFKSQGERDRYIHLKRFEEIGEISDLKVSPRYLLQEKFEYRGMKFPAQYYNADFEYCIDGIVWAEDWKKLDKRKGRAYVPNKTTIGRFLFQDPDVNFVLVSELDFLPGKGGEESS